MKKMLALFISLMMILFLSGCGGSEDDINGSSYVPDTQLNSNETSSDTTSPDATSSNITSANTTSPDASSNSDITIDTEYYTLSLPNSWKGNYSYEISNGENGVYDLSFYENKSHKSIEGGWLFSIILLTENEDYTYYPSYGVLGSIEVKNTGSYNLIAIYPTDVQFTREAAKTYNEMFDSVAGILKTILFKNICTFSKEPIPVKSETGT